MSFGFEKSDVSVKSIFSVGAVSVIIIIAIIIILSQYFSRVREDMIQDMILKRVSVKLVKLQDYESQQLSTYGVIDKEKGIYRIPIDEAIREMVAGN